MVIYSTKVRSPSSTWSIPSLKEFALLVLVVVVVVQGVLVVVDVVLVVDMVVVSVELALLPFAGAGSFVDALVFGSSIVAVTDELIGLRF